MRSWSAFILSLAGAALFISCAALQSDSEAPPGSSAGKASPFRVKQGVEIWDDTAVAPGGKAVYIDSVDYTDGKSVRELEDKALRHAKTIGATGFWICRTMKTGEIRDYEVGRREGDLTTQGFDLKDHGVVQEDLHYGKVVSTAGVFFRIRVKFFRER